VNCYGGGQDRFFIFFKKPRDLSTGRTQTDDQGRFAFGRLKKGRFHVLVVHPKEGIQVVPDLKMPNSDDPAEIVLEAPTFVEGRIVGCSQRIGELRPVERLPWQAVVSSGEHVRTDDLAHIWIQPKVMLDADGGFRAGPLPGGGRWTLAFEQPVLRRRFNATLLQVPVTVVPGQTARVDIDLTAGRRLQGIVSGPHNEKLSEVAVEVSVDHDGGSAVFGGVTDSQGHFEIEGLPPGEHHLLAYRSGPGEGPAPRMFI
jgi:hypothetical protein